MTQGRVRRGLAWRPQAGPERGGLIARHRKTGVLILLVASSLVMLLLSTRSLAGLPQRIGLTFSSLFQTGFHSVGDFFSQTADSIAELRRLKANYEAAMEKLAQYETIERGLAETRAENERLKRQLDFSSQDSLRKLSARVIAKDPGNFHTTIVIDRGVKDGLRKNLPVIAYQDGVQGLVGRVTEVGRSSSIVLPIYDQSSNVAARMERNRYEGLASGSGDIDTPLLLRYVKKLAKEDIQFGDLVVTSGMWRTYPEGIAIGRVAELLEEDYKTSVEYRLEPVIDFSRLEYVFVVFMPEAALE
jgi:rod shape-determining protein MreC